MDSITSDILSRLKFIGKIQPSEKINVKYLHVQHDSWITGILRTLFAQDNRNNALLFFRTTLDKSFEIIETNKTKHEKYTMIVNIIKDIENSLIGISNFKETYKTDLMFCCQIDTLVQNIKIRLDEAKQIISSEDVT
jgi:hypothetical protein